MGGQYDLASLNKDRAAMAAIVAPAVIVACPPLVFNAVKVVLVFCSYPPIVFNAPTVVLVVNVVPVGTAVIVVLVFLLPVARKYRVFVRSHKCVFTNPEVLPYS